VGDELLHDPAHEVHWDRKAQALRRRPIGAYVDDGRIDADELAARVDERAAGIPGVDGRIGLNEVLEDRDA
jgi:hypothetical protein